MTRTIIPEVVVRNSIKLYTLSQKNGTPHCRKAKKLKTVIKTTIPGIAWNKNTIKKERLSRVNIFQDCEKSVSIDFMWMIIFSLACLQLFYWYYFLFCQPILFLRGEKIFYARRHVKKPRHSRVSCKSKDYREVSGSWLYSEGIRRTYPRSREEKNGNRYQKWFYSYLHNRWR